MFCALSLKTLMLRNERNVNIRQMSNAERMGKYSPFFQSAFDT